RVAGGRGTAPAGGRPRSYADDAGRAPLGPEARAGRAELDAASGRGGLGRRARARYGRAALDARTVRRLAAPLERRAAPSRPAADVSVRASVTFHQAGE